MPCQLKLPGDKSIAHRALMLATLAKGPSIIKNLPDSDDVNATIDIVKALGAKIEKDESSLKLIPPTKFSHGVTLLAAESGTTFRLMLGLLAGLPIKSRLIGRGSLVKRPMDRVLEPLKQMGADINLTYNDGKIIANIQGRRLVGINFENKIASAQVKSAILLAALNSDGVTKISQPRLSRDHTELMMKWLGLPIKLESSGEIKLNAASFKGTQIVVPGDISSASYFWIASLLKKKRVVMEGVGINPTRTGILDLFSQMGARVSKTNECFFGYEPVADVSVSADNLKGFHIGGQMIPRLIDEIPAIIVLASQARGESVISGCGELRFKESNRIEAINKEFSKLGVKLKVTDEEIKVTGPSKINGGEAFSHNDHRIAISLILLSKITFQKSDEVKIRGLEAISKSYPNFLKDFKEFFP